MMYRFKIMVTVTVLLAAAAWSIAQQTPTASPEAAREGTRIDETQDVGKTTTLWGVVKQGGVIMFPLGLLSVGAIGLIVYGFITVQESKMLHPELLPDLRDQLDELDLEGAQHTCEETPCLLTNTLHAGLTRISDGVVDVDSMEKAMEEASVQEVNAGMKPINYLSIIAQISPMLGLLGTVSGMIKAFQKIGLGGMGKPEMLAEDIGEAMVTTATGLIIGIPAMFFYFYLKNRYTSNVSQMTRVLGDLAHRLATAGRQGGRKVAKAVAPKESKTAEVEA